MTSEATARPAVVPPSSDVGTVDKENPWPGLAAFREVDRPFFKGREPAIESFHRLVLRGLFSVLYGLSGLGKTSLLAAGLFHRLREEDYLPVYIRLDFSSQSLDLVAQVKDALFREAAAEKIKVPASHGGETLWELFHRRGTELWSPRNRIVVPVLVFDQFEEIFTLGRSRPEFAPARQAFLTQLADLIEGRPPAALKAQLDRAPEQARAFSFTRHPYKVVLSLREEYLPHLQDLRSLIPTLALQSMHHLRPMTGEDALQVVVGAGGHLVAQGVAEKIIRLVAGGEEGSTPSETEPLADVEVEPALLSLFCRELNNRRREKGLPKIEAELLAGARGQILASFYERSLNGFDPRLRSFIEDRLLTGTGFRQSEPLDDALQVPGVTLAAIEQLVDYRLLRREEHLGQPHIELIHDVLAPVARVSRDLRREREASRRQSRRVFTVTAVALVILFGLVIVWSQIQVSRERSREEQKKRQETEALMDALVAGLDSPASPRPVSSPLDDTRVLDQVVSQLEARYSDEPPSGSAARSYLKILDYIGGRQLAGRKPEAAVATFKKRQDLAERLFSQAPENDEWRHELAASREGIGDAASLMDNPQEALKEYMASVALVEPPSKQPGGAVWKQQLAALHVKLGDALLKEGKPAEALAHYQQSSSLTGQLGGATPSSDVQEKLAVARSKVGDIELAQGKVPNALESYQQSQTSLQGLVKEKPDNFDWRRDLAEVSFKLGWGLLCQQPTDFDAAFKAFRESFVGREPLARRDPANVILQEELAASFYALADVVVRRNDPTSRGAGPCGSAAGRLANTPFQKHFPAKLPIDHDFAGNDPVWRSTLSDDYVTLGNALNGERDARGALAAYSLALEVRESLQRSNREKNRIAWSHVLVGTAFDGLSRRDLARREWTKALAIIEEIPPTRLTKSMLDTRAQTLLYLDRLEDAKVVVEQLCQGEGWTNPRFRELARKKGLVLEDIPEGGCRLVPPGSP